jgi:hypothetical protein
MSSSTPNSHHSQSGNDQSEHFFDPYFWTSNPYTANQYDATVYPQPHAETDLMHSGSTHIPPAPNVVESYPPVATAYRTNDTQFGADLFSWESSSYAASPSATQHNAGE